MFVHPQFAPSPTNTASSGPASRNARIIYYSRTQCYTRNTTPKVRLLLLYYFERGLSPPTAEAMQAKLGTLSLEAQSKLEKEAAKKEAKAEAKADAALKKKMVCDLVSVDAAVFTRTHPSSVICRPPRCVLCLYLILQLRRC